MKLKQPSASHQKQRQQAERDRADSRAAAVKLQQELQLLLNEKHLLETIAAQAEAAVNETQEWQEQLLQEVSRLHAATQEIASSRSTWSTAVEGRALAADSAYAQVDQLSCSISPFKHEPCTVC